MQSAKATNMCREAEPQVELKAFQAVGLLRPCVLNVSLVSLLLWSLFGGTSTVSLSGVLCKARGVGTISAAQKQASNKQGASRKI